MDINSFVKQFDVGLDQSKIVKSGKNYFYASQELQDVRSKIKRDVFSLGIYLGCDSGKHFEPSPALIDIISKLAGAEKFRIFVNEKAETLFLYGRNILEESISRNPNNIKEGLVLIQNDKDENLGYGLFQTQGDDVVIKNLLDKGEYLRKESKKKKR